jgi:hypothetical protein
VSASDADERPESPAEPTVEGTKADAATPEAAAVTRLRTLSHYLDSAVRVPGTEYRVGLDPLVGLLPVVGDAPAAAASAYIVAEAAGLGVPRSTLARMVVNLVVDAVFGSIPVVGDLFDAAWKANQRNVRLLEARRSDPAGSARDRRVVLAAAVALFCLLLGLAAASAVVVWWLLGAAGAA